MGRWYSPSGRDKRVTDNDVRIEIGVINPKLGEVEVTIQLGFGGEPGAVIEIDGGWLHSLIDRLFRRGAREETYRLVRVDSSDAATGGYRPRYRINYEEGER